MRLNNNSFVTTNIISSASYNATRIYLDVLDSLLDTIYKQIKISVYYDLIQL